jgi:hypothetical protein
MKHVEEITEALPKKTRAGSLTAKLVMIQVEVPAPLEVQEMVA